MLQQWYDKMIRNLAAPYIVLYALFRFLNVSWMWPVLDTVSTVLYMALCTAWMWRVRKNTLRRVPQLWLALIYLILLLGVISYPWMVLPWILLYPLLKKTSEHRLKKLGAGLVYGVFVLMMLLVLLVHLLASVMVSIQDVAEAASPDGIHLVTVTQVDQGALGVDFKTTLGTRILYVFRQSRVISNEDYYGGKVWWEDHDSFHVEERTYHLSEL